MSIDNDNGEQTPRPIIVFVFVVKPVERTEPELPIKYDDFGPYCEIPLTRGRFAKVDPEDFIWLSQFRWYCNNRVHTSYAIRNAGKGNGQEKILMHREIKKTPKELVCDHINRDGLDNRKRNLRNCTARENNLNVGAREGTTSKYKGVYLNRRMKKWAASIKSGDRKMHLGYFHNEKDAAIVYDKMAKELFGEFAYLNFTEKP